MFHNNTSWRSFSPLTKSVHNQNSFRGLTIAVLKRQKRQEQDLQWPAFTEDERGRQCWRISASLFFAQTEVNHKPSIKNIFQDRLFSLPTLLWYSSKRATFIHYKLMYMEMYTSFWDAIVGWRNAFVNTLTTSSTAFNQMCFWCAISHLSSKHSMSGRRVMPFSLTRPRKVTLENLSYTLPQLPHLFFLCGCSLSTCGSHGWVAPKLKAWATAAKQTC